MGLYLVINFSCFYLYFWKKKSLLDHRTKEIYDRTDVHEFSKINFKYEGTKSEFE